MKFIDWLRLRSCLRKRPRPSPLKTELRALQENYKRTEEKMRRLSSDFWERGGVCCPFCGVLGYSELAEKQERREDRMKQIKDKLKRDSRGSYVS